MIVLMYSGANVFKSSLIAMLYAGVRSAGVRCGKRCVKPKAGPVWNSNEMEL